MKNFKFTGLICLITVLIFCQPELNRIEENPGRFTLHKDGTVTIKSLLFRNFSEYVESDYFKKHEMECRINHPKPEDAQTKYRAASDCTVNQTFIQNKYWPLEFHIVPIVFHIITMEDGTGDIPNQRIHEQVMVLNEDFGAFPGTLGEAGFDTRIRFQLAGITRTANNVWHSNISNKDYKNRLAWDQERYLNVYIHGGDGFLGQSSFPQEVAGTIQDGIELMYMTVGGRDNKLSPERYNQGRILVHEAGHYFGLYHTFEGTWCANSYTSGDLIVDTNSESIPHRECFQTYTCDTADPIHNYMNYNRDDCRYEFTPEQANRMICSIIHYRPHLTSSYYSPLNAKVKPLINDLIFRQEKLNLITWEANPGNEGIITTYLIFRKGPDDKNFILLSEVDGYEYWDRNVGDEYYSYEIRGIDDNGTQSIPIVTTGGQS